MPAARPPSDEEDRLRLLGAYEPLAPWPETSLQRICAVAAELSQTPIAVVTLLGQQHQFFKASVGLQLRQTDRSTALCGYTVLQDDVLVVEDATRDPRFADMQLVVEPPQLRFYAGEPIRTANGVKLGALCVIDTVARTLSTDQLGALRALAREVEVQLELRRQWAEGVRLREQQRRIGTGLLEEVSDPLTALRLTASAIGSAVEPDDLCAESLRLLRELEYGADWLGRLVENFRDLRAEDTVPIRPGDGDVALLVDRVCRAANPLAHARRVVLRAEIESSRAHVRCDEGLVRRVLETLVVDAIDDAAEGGNVRILTRDGPQGSTEFWVEHDGAGFHVEDRAWLFDLRVTAPRGRRTLARQIGLSFGRNAARAHGGELDLRLDPAGHPSFCLTLPGVEANPERASA